MQNVPLLPLGDITNGCQPSSVDLDEKKEQIKARRRAAYRKKKEEAASKQLDEKQLEEEHKGDLTDEQTEQRNARRRASYRKKVGDGTIDLQEKNQKLQEWRVQHPKTMTEDERGESSAKRKAKYAAKKNTPCAESIAMPRPDLTSTLSNPHTHCPTLTLSALTQQFDSEQIDHAPTVNAAPTYIRNTETDGTYPINHHLSSCNNS